MGRRTAGNCKCGTCNYPIAYGIDHGVWGAFNTFADPLTSPAELSTFANYFNSRNVSGMCYICQDAAEINETDFFCSTGANGPLDVLYLGAPPFQVSTYTGEVTLPTIGGDIDLAVIERLEAGRICYVAVCRHLTATDARIATYNTYLAHLDSSVVLYKKADYESAELVSPTIFGNYKPLIPSNSLWAANPDTWLTAGQELSCRVHSHWDERLRLDGRRQSGVLTPTAVPYGDYTDFSAGQGVLDYPTSLATNRPYGAGPVNVFMTCDAGHILTAFPYGQTEFASSTEYPGATHVQGVGANGGYTYTRKDTGTLQVGANKVLVVSASVEVLPNGGKLIVALTPLTTGGFIHQLIKKLMHPTCRVLTHGLCHEISV